MKQRAHFNRKQRVLVCLAVGLLVLLLVRSLYAEFAKHPADLTAAVLNGGIVALNVVLSPIFLLMALPLFFILFTLFKTPNNPLDRAESPSDDKPQHI